MKHIKTFEKSSRDKLEFAVGDIVFFNSFNIKEPKYGKKYLILRIYAGNSELKKISTFQLDNYYVEIKDVKTCEISKGCRASKFQRKIINKNKPSIDYFEED